MKSLISTGQLVKVRVIYLLVVRLTDPFVHIAEISSSNNFFHLIKFRQGNCRNVPKERVNI